MTDIEAQNVYPVQADDLDDLFDYNVDDAFRDVDTNMDIPAREKIVAKADGKENGAGLGIDEEIKVTKKRAPVPKLDENRLLSSAGIPKLRRITKERLKFKGKGHEYSDVARLLTVYQLWLDDLYPRAKFADGLAIIEKLGHTKRLQTMRKEWITEGRPRETVRDFASARQESNSEQRASELGQEQSLTADPKSNPRTPPMNGRADANKGELYPATPEAIRNLISNREQSSMESLFVSDEEDGRGPPPDDDLEALIMEDGMKEAANTAIAPMQEQENLGKYNDFDDEMEAMAGMTDTW